MQMSSESKSLVLVVGAGASKEVNLPIGSELKRSISEILNMRSKNSYSLSDRENFIIETMREVAVKNGRPGALNRYLDASRRISEALPLAISIDNFIDQHRSDPVIADCGKIAIASCILNSESNSPLYINKNLTNSRKLNFSLLGGTWFEAFFQILTENCQYEDLLERFRKIAIICFNYDRCIEHFLYLAIQDYYGVGPNEANNVLEGLEIHHPYGTVGKLPWQDQEQGISFGAVPDPDQLATVVGELRTFTEGTDPKISDISAIRATLTNTEQIAFIGFAFHRLNLELLFPGIEGIFLNCQIYGTALGLSDSDVELIRNEIMQTTGVDECFIQLKNQLNCNELFHEYRRTFSLL